MKIDIEFTHEGWFYGCPVFVSFEGDGFMPIPVIPLTGWWIGCVAPVIQAVQSFFAGVFGAEPDSPLASCFMIERCHPLAKPFIKTFDWPEEVCSEYRKVP